jgi:excinuclease ABC subunit A
MRNIEIKGARQHNLKDIDIKIPRNKLVVITGLSGSGKSTLAFDTLYAEGQRRYVESLSAYARQFLAQMNKPDVDSIDGLSPAISIEQRTTSRNPRSTVGTVTEIYDYLRLLYARIGIPHCPEHNIRIERQSPAKIANRIAEELSGQITVLSPIVRQKKGTYAKLISDLNKEGYTRVRVNKKIQRTDKKVKLERYKKHDIEIVIDRLDIEDKERLAEAVENSLKKSEGLIIILDEKSREHLYSAKLACPICGIAFEELQPRSFSFNSPFGACEACHGLGIKMDFDPDLIIPDKEMSIAEGAIAVYRNVMDGWRSHYIAALAKHFDFDMLAPVSEMKESQYNALMFGSSDRIKFNLTMHNGDTSWSRTSQWEGLLPQCERLYQQTESDYRRRELEKFMRVSPCPSCNGKRLKSKILSVTIDDRNIMEVAEFSIKNAIDFFRNLDQNLSKKDHEIGRLILKEINERLSFLDKVGLNYLTLSRAASTLSGGEAQRIRLATQIGSNLMGVLYILDEPSIGLHQVDNQKLIDTLQRLRNLGNTLIVVEHDENTIMNSDYVIDMGPGAGVHGGEVVAMGTPKQIMRSKQSLTGQYLSGKLIIPVPKERRRSRHYLRIIGCSEHNLKNIDVKIPIGILNLVTGVSGSGKSTLVYDILYKGLWRKLHNYRMRAGKHDKILLDSVIDKVIVIDQSPIGKTPRSNPVTYIKVFDDIRKIFSETKESKVRGYKPGRFSFNVRGGRCEACHGDGLIKIEMNFLPDVYIECEECKGSRYNNETLEILYKGKSISDVLDMTVEEALDHFENIPSIRNRLETLNRVGLGYIKLGQSSTTLSGGEAQRIKLTRELSKKATGRTLYLLDEPTTGLHFHDVKKLLKVLNDLVDKGNTIIVIEHNPDVIKCADNIIDLGPEGGDDGGFVVASGTPEQVAQNPRSYTGQVLKGVLK